MKNSLFQCLCTYIWVSRVPINPQTMKFDHPVIFFVGCLGLKTWDSTHRSDFWGPIYIDRRLIWIISPPSSDFFQPPLENHLGKCAALRLSKKLRAALLFAAQTSTNRYLGPQPQWTEELTGYSLFLTATFQLQAAKTCMCVQTTLHQTALQHWTGNETYPKTGNNTNCLWQNCLFVSWIGRRL